MRRSIVSICVPVCAAALVSSASAEVTLPKAFGDHMVLQQGMPVPVWGRAGAGEKVTVNFAGQTKEATASEDGKWMVKLDALTASKDGREMTVAGKNTLTLTDVVVGEVWLCAGQSNMELTVRGCLNFEAEKAAATNGLIRHFKMAHQASSMPREDISGQWTACSPETVAGFTAAGYFFAREVAKELDVPVGLIGANWGGTRIEPWTCAAGFRDVPELAEISASVEDWEGRSEAGRKRWAEHLAQLKGWITKAEAALAAQQDMPAMPEAPVAPTANTTPTHLYNGMIVPLVPFALRGALWYQGEANRSEGTSYFHKMQALVGGWRQVWGQGEFPFYYVQLPNYQRSDANNAAGGDGWTKLREAQAQAMSISNTGMAVIIDVGEADNLHPKNKQDVGKRLALWALARTYGKKDLVHSGPIYKSHTVEGNQIRVTFDSVGSGLMVGEKKGLDPVQPSADGKLKWVAVAGEDKVWHWADAVIENNTIVASSPKVEKPVALRYAFAMNPEGANLYNKEGLPACPFRTDSW